MSITFTPLEDARNELDAALRYGVIADVFARERIIAALGILRDHTRAGNLSPEYQRRVDEFNRQEARNV